VQLIGLTRIFYGLLAFVFGMHLFFLGLSLCIERSTYRYFIGRKFCEESPELGGQKIGYRSGDKIYVYPRE